MLAALAPDGELPVWDLWHLDNHVRTCSSCQSFAEAVHQITHALRTHATAFRERQNATADTRDVAAWWRRRG